MDKELYNASVQNFASFFKKTYYFVYILYTFSSCRNYLRILFFDTLSSKLKSIDETLAILIISKRILSIRSTDLHQKVQEVKILFFLISLYNFQNYY